MITTTDSQVSVLLVDNNSTDAVVFLDVALDTYNGNATLYDTRDAIEDYMKTEGLAFLNMEIVVEGVNDATECEEIVRSVVFCEAMLTAAPETIFLTSQKTKCIPRGLSECIHFFYPGTGTITENWKLYYVNNNGSIVRIMDNRYWGGENRGVKSLTVSDGSLKSDYRVDGDVIAASLTIGNRKMMLYFVDKQPDLVLSFRNVFNVVERAFLNGTTKVISSAEKTRATCGGIDSFYDVNNTIEFQFESAPLSIDMAAWLKQLVLSPYIQKGNEEVLITEHTCEVSDADDELNSVKFTYQYPDGRERLDITADDSDTDPEADEDVNNDDTNDEYDDDQETEITE